MLASIAAGVGPATPALAMEAPRQLKIASVQTGGLLSCRYSPASAPPKRAKLSARTTVLGTRRHRRALQIPIAR